MVGCQLDFLLTVACLIRPTVLHDEYAGLDGVSQSFFHQAASTRIRERIHPSPNSTLATEPNLGLNNEFSQLVTRCLIGLVEDRSFFVGSNTQLLVKIANVAAGYHSQQLAESAC